MKVILEERNRYVLRFDTGENMVRGITDFCEEHGIAGAYFNAIGACGELILAYYHLPDRHYEDHELKENLEIVSMYGSIALGDDRTVIMHAHGVFSKRNLETVGGHVKKLVVSVTGEVVLIKLSGAITRGYDASTRLNLTR